MSHSDFHFQSPWPARLLAMLEVLMISGIVSGSIAMLVFSAKFGRTGINLMELSVEFLVTYLMFESVVMVIILWVLMKTHGETFAMLGVRKRRWKTCVLLGILAAPGLLVISGIASRTFAFLLPEYVLEKNPLVDMIGSPQQLTLFIIATILAGGVKEELQRAFILRRFSSHLGGAGVGIVVWSLVFGAGHYTQGVQGMFVTTILGFIFGVLYIARGNLILTITAHAAYNTLTLLIYWFAIGMNK